MAANRPTTAAPQTLLQISKTTLADIVWELAGTAPGVSCDDHLSMLRTIRNAALKSSGSSADVKSLDGMIGRWKT